MGFIYQKGVQVEIYENGGVEGGVMFDIFNIFDDDILDIFDDSAEDVFYCPICGAPLPEGLLACVFPHYHPQEAV